MHETRVRVDLIIIVAVCAVERTVLHRSAVAGVKSSGEDHQVRIVFCMNVTAATCPFRRVLSKNRPYRRV